MKPYDYTKNEILHLLKKHEKGFQKRLAIAIRILNKKSVKFKYSSAGGMGVCVFYRNGIVLDESLYPVAFKNFDKEWNTMIDDFNYCMTWNIE